MFCSYSSIFIFVPLLKTTQLVKCRKEPFGKLNLIFDAETLPCSFINLKMFNSEFTLIWSFHSLFTLKNILEMDKDTMQLIQYFSIAIKSIVSALYLPLPGCPVQSYPSVHVYTYSPTVQHPCHLTFMLIWWWCIILHFRLHFSFSEGPRSYIWIRCYISYTLSHGTFRSNFKLWAQFQDQLTLMGNLDFHI